MDTGSQLSLAVSGLPGKIVAGSGWHNFTLTAANHSDQDLGQVQWLATVDNYSDSDDENDWLSTFAQLEYFNPTSKSWESIADEAGSGVYFGETTLGGKQTVAIKLRVNISSKAPAGDGYALGLGGYVDQEKDCVHSSFALYELTVLAPGSSNENPGEPKPGKGDKPSGGTKPQGGADEIPATGSLASTGSSSALPTIALVGGIAVVAGRRRGVHGASSQVGWRGRVSGERHTHVGSTPRKRRRTWARRGAQVFLRVHMSRLPSCTADGKLYCLRP